MDENELQDCGADDSGPPTCPECDYWKEMIEIANSQIAAVRASGPLEDFRLATHLSPRWKETEELQASLKEMVLAQIAHQRKAHLGA